MFLSLGNDGSGVVRGHFERIWPLTQMNDLADAYAFEVEERRNDEEMRRRDEELRRRAAERAAREAEERRLAAQRVAAREAQERELAARDRSEVERKAAARARVVPLAGWRWPKLSRCNVR